MQITRSQSVIPFAVKLIAFNHQRGELFIGDLDARRVRVFIKNGLDMQSLGGGCAADQIDHHFPTDEWPASPVGGDVAEHAMFYLVPSAGSWREVTDLNRQLLFVGQPLQLPAPQAHPVTIATTAISGNEQAACLRINLETAVECA